MKTQKSSQTTQTTTMTKKKTRNYKYDYHYRLPRLPHLGRARFKLKGEPMYRTIENVSKSTVRKEIHKMYPGSRIEYLSEIEEYEDGKEKYHREYLKNYMKQKNYENYS